MAFDRSFLDELQARCDIVDVVSRYVQLKKSGSNYFGLCPFHNEKTASFSVSADKQIFHCFGCGAGGGAIRFVMQVEGLEYPDAVRFLAQQYHLPVKETKREDPGVRQRRERLQSLCTDAARFFYAQLQRPENAGVKGYFVRRGLSRKTMNDFGLGYAPDSFDALIRAMTEKGYTKEEMLAAGLVARSEKGHYYDKFRHRVMFPIIDIRGNVIAFGGRVMDDSKPKYLNSPETSLFHKSRNLFAMNLARKSKAEYFLLAEGYMDVIALHQAGFDSAVASLGTSLTEEQARILSRHTSQVIICYDADDAGQRAAQRAIDILKNAGLSVKVLKIPGAKDPDEFIREHGADAFRSLLEKSENHIEYRIERIRSRYNLREDTDRIQFVREAAQEIARLDSPIEREVYTGRVADIAGVVKTAVDLEVKNERQKQRRKQKDLQHREIRAPAAAAQPKDRQLHYEDVKSARAEEGLIGLIFNDAELLPELSKRVQPSDFTVPTLAKIYAYVLSQQEAGRAFTIGDLEAVLDDGEISLISGILSKPVSLAAGHRAMEDYIHIMEMQRAKKKQETDGEDPLADLARQYREKMGVGGDKV